MNFPELPAAEKSRILCELYGIKVTCGYCLETECDHNVLKDYPRLTTDFLLELAMENKIEVRMVLHFQIKPHQFCARVDSHGKADGCEEQANNPTDALAMALIRFKGGVV